MTARNSELRDALIAARDGPAILAALARVEWRRAHPGEDCPADAIPSEGDLCAWLPECPEETAAQAGARIDAMAAFSPGEPSGWRWTVYTPQPEIAVTDLATDRVIEGPALVAARPEPPGFATFAAVHSHWVAMGGLPDPRPPHPLACILAAWQGMPAVVNPEQRQDRRILPTVRASGQESRPERQRGMLFGGLLDGRSEGSPELPLFEAAPVRKSVAILDIADAAGVPVMARGRGAPLSARLFVRAGLSVAPRDRRRQSVRIALTVRELRDGLFPNGWNGLRDWRKVETALMGARDYTIRLPDGGRWFMLALRRLPPEYGAGLPSLDDEVVLDIAFPPGASDGPPIDLPTQDALSVESAPRWRAYIAAHALSWKPGRTRRPMPDHGNRFGWSRDPADYPILTAEDRRRLAFGEADRKHRTASEIDAAWRDLPGIVLAAEKAVDPQTGEVGWRIIPTEAAPDGD